MTAPDPAEAERAAVLARRAELVAIWHTALRAEWDAEAAWHRARETTNAAEAQLEREGFNPHGAEIIRRGEHRKEPRDGR